MDGKVQSNINKNFKTHKPSRTLYRVLVRSLGKLVFTDALKKWFKKSEIVKHFHIFNSDSQGFICEKPKNSISSGLRMKLVRAGDQEHDLWDWSCLSLAVWWHNRVNLRMFESLAAMMSVKQGTRTVINGLEFDSRCSSKSVPAKKPQNWNKRTMKMQQCDYTGNQQSIFPLQHFRGSAAVSYTMFCFSFNKIWRKTENLKLPTFLGGLH